MTKNVENEIWKQEICGICGKSFTREEYIVSNIMGSEHGRVHFDCFHKFTNIPLPAEQSLCIAKQRLDELKAMDSKYARFYRAYTKTEWRERGFDPEWIRDDWEE